MRKVLIILLIIAGVYQYADGQDYYKVRRARFSTGTDDERAPTPYRDGLVLMSNASMSSVVENLGNAGEKFFNLYYIEESDKSYGQADMFATELNTKGIGYPTFSADGSLMAYSKHYRVPRAEVEYPLGIFFADEGKYRWENEREYEYNDPGYSLITPWLTDDGTTLYFAADFEEGYGGFDIYVSKFERGKWTEPENMGPNVNTEQNEKDPFYHPMGKLYFSSNGFDRTGGYDIFVSDFYEGEWTPAEKLSFRRINSGSDEYALRFSDNFKTGYFERRGGTLDIMEISTDIPVFEEPKKFKSNYHRRFLLRENSLHPDSIDPELFSIAWVIDDTIVIPELETIHAFPGPGTYNVRFEVYDILLDSTKVIINREQVVPFRTQAAISCPDTVLVNVEFRLDATETYLPDFDIDKYYWDFGDGISAEGIRSRHTYKFPGKYTIVLGVKERVRNRREEATLISNYKEITVLPSR